MISGPTCRRKKGGVENWTEGIMIFVLRMGILRGTEKPRPLNWYKMVSVGLQSWGGGLRVVAKLQGNFWVTILMAANLKIENMLEKYKYKYTNPRKNRSILL